MADALPSGYPFLNGVYVEPAMALPLLTLMDERIRQLRSSDLQLDERLNRLLSALEGMAKVHRGESPMTVERAVRWVSIADAAEMLGVSHQAVRDMTRARYGALPWRSNGRSILVEEGAVKLRVMNRADGAKRRKALQSPQPVDLVR